MRSSLLPSGREIDEIRMITGLSRGEQAGKAGGHVEPLDLEPIVHRALRALMLATTNE